MSLVLFFLFFTVSCRYFAAPVSEHPIIVILSYDGFRYDYLDSKGVNPVLKGLRDQGTYAEYMNNCFITKTYTNHHSIATGLYPETHGILGNQVFDPKYGKGFSYSYELFHYSDDILPIWIANEKKGGGRHSGIMMWPGNEYNYSGIIPTHQREWEEKYKWEKRVDDVIDWILDPVKPANLVLMYFEQPDSDGHKFGPDADEYIDTLKKMDNITKYFVDRLKEKRLIDKVNLFFLADHGLQGVRNTDIIDLRKFVPSDKFTTYESSPIFMIYPKKGEANFVYRALKNASEAGSPFKVYKKDELPERWHYQNNRRTPPILAVADPPYVFQDFLQYIEYKEKSLNFTATASAVSGTHGYDNEVMNMKPFFIAVGPLIKKNHKIEPFENVDLFSLWANMLGFPEMAVNTNGSYERVSDMLISKYKPTDIGNFCGAIAGILLTGISAAIVIFLIQNKLRFRNKVFHRRASEENFESRQRLLDNAETEEEA